MWREQTSTSGCASSRCFRYTVGVTGEWRHAPTSRWCLVCEDGGGILSSGRVMQSDTNREVPRWKQHCWKLQQQLNGRSVSVSAPSGCTVLETGSCIMFDQAGEEAYLAWIENLANEDMSWLQGEQWPLQTKIIQRLSLPLKQTDAVFTMYITETLHTCIAGTSTHCRFIFTNIVYCL